MTNNTGSLLYVADAIAQNVVLVTAVVVFLVLIAMLAVFLDQNLKYLELVIEKAYNFDENRSLSNHSRGSSADENQAYPAMTFKVRVKERGEFV